MKIGVLIPAYNESGRIRQLIKTISSSGLSPTVIDDGSSDRTTEEAKAGGAKVIRHEQNQGKGASLKTGFEYMLTEKYDAVLIMDGDGQHSPDDIQKFIDLANSHQEIMIVGNRMNDTKNMPLARKLTNMFMSFIISLICRQKIPDSQCGFRLIKDKLLKNIKIESLKFQVESEILIKASHLGTKIVSIPIKTVYGKETSQIRPFWDAYRFITFLFKLPFIKY